MLSSCWARPGCKSHSEDDQAMNIASSPKYRAVDGTWFDGSWPQHVVVSAKGLLIPGEHHPLCTYCCSDRVKRRRCRVKCSRLRRPARFFTPRVLRLAQGLAAHADGLVQNIEYVVMCWSHESSVCQEHVFREIDDVRGCAGANSAR